VRACVCVCVCVCVVCVRVCVCVCVCVCARAQYWREFHCQAKSILVFFSQSVCLMNESAPSERDERAKAR
jgi:hypothetical protein